MSLETGPCYLKSTACQYVFNQEQSHPNLLGKPRTPPIIQFSCNISLAMSQSYHAALLLLAAVLPCVFAAISNSKETMMILGKHKPSRVGPADFSYEEDGKGPRNWGGI